MHPKELARQRAEALFKPLVSQAKAPSRFDDIKARAAEAHAASRVRRDEPSASTRPLFSLSKPISSAVLRPGR